MPDIVKYRNYILNIFRNYHIHIIILSIIFIIYISLLKSIGEFLSDNDIYKMTVSNNEIIWNSGFYDSGHHLKLGIGAYIDPKVAILGSSRVLQIRKKMFDKIDKNAFYNFGGAVYNISDTIKVIDKLGDSDNLDLIIIGIDWSWLQVNNDNENEIKSKIKNIIGNEILIKYREYRNAYNNNIDYIVDHIQILQSAWRTKQFYSALLNPKKYDPVSGRLLVGIGARSLGGFRNDGSYRYWNAIVGNNGSLSDKIKEGFDRFYSGHYTGNDIDNTSLFHLGRFLDKCSKDNINVILFLPPLMPSIYKLFTTHHNSKLFWEVMPDVLKNITEKYNFSFYDFSNHDYSQNQDEYLDWFHGSDVLYAKLLMEILYSEEGRPLLSPYVESNLLKKDIGNAVSPLDLYGD